MRTSDILVIAPNFKRRLSGVTSTIIQLVPLQAKSLPIVAFGPGLPKALPKLRGRQLAGLWKRPRTRPFRLWHARRNVEMLPGILMRDVLRMPLRLVFTSASQRRHTAYTRWLIGRMDAVIATSSRSGAYLSVPHSVVTHGIDLDRFRPAGDGEDIRHALGLPDLKTVGCFGRIRRQKGSDLFVDAMIALLPDRPGWQAILCGRATAEHAGFEAELKRRVAAAGLSDRILFLGEFSDVAPYYRALDLFVAPQRWEGFGLTPLEAMASGVPVVAADVGVFSDVVAPGAGEIVAPDELRALVAATARWMDDGDMRGAGAKRSLETARRNFPLEREAAEIRAVYDRLWDVDGP
ncbi:glycosyltransferase family 4 protein [Aureimonas altamirensis]|uniref:glycosyltransferase family 4 protein n=1 Tax=Aureimonas altamirensis TaxID=370622 RepID=UPI002036B62D|nr:glycosyltransferase family 4 protein [Aureimonas altamirensis]MCM2502346.1 glycosyltransferase family 4 protein [Aureimonas altamirensis]